MTAGPPPEGEVFPLVALWSGAGMAVVTATVLASLIGFVDASVINVAVPAIGRSLNASVTSLQWTLTSYLLAVAVLLLLAGALADHFGRRQVLAAGLLVMLLASIGCAVAPSVGVLIAARVFQGVGAALVVPSSLSLLNGTLRDSDRARGIGVWAGLATLGTTLGPYAGGWLTDNISWRALFLLNPPLALAGLFVLWFVPQTDTVRRPLSLDAPGALLAAAGLGGVIYALTAGAESGWASPPVVAAGAVGVLCLVGLVLVERRQRAPMLRLALFASRQFDAINVATVLVYGGIYAASYLVILQFQLRLGYSAAQAGAALIPESVVFLVVAPISGALVGRIGPRGLMVVGMLCLAAGFTWLSAAHPGQQYVVAILPGVLLWGLGTGVFVTPLTSAVLAAVGDADLGEAAAINDAASRVGGVVAVALVPALIGAGGGIDIARALSHGYQPAMLVLAGLCVAAALVSALFVSNRGVAATRLVPPARCHSCAVPIPGPVPGPQAT